jgi:choice-of-anchor A domain-containing protein
MRFSVSRALAGAIFLGAGAVANAAGIPGPAAGYSVFDFGKGMFEANNSDASLNVAAAGNVGLMNYSVATSIVGIPGASPNPANLVVGGTLTAQNGGVGSNQDGTIYVGGTVSLTGFTANGGTKPQTLIDFSAAQTQYDSLSTSLSNLTPNGSVVVSNGGGTLTLTGSSSSLNVFSLPGSDITAANTFNITAPSSSTIIINVSGDTVFQNGQMNVNGVADGDSANILFNFITSGGNTLKLSGSMAVDGSILAPFSTTTAGSGNVYGQLITDSYGGINGNAYGEAQFEDTPFTGTLPTVPLPGTLGLLASGAALALVLTRRRDARVSAFVPKA